MNITVSISDEAYEALNWFINRNGGVVTTVEQVIQQQVDKYLVRVTAERNNVVDRLILEEVGKAQGNEPIAAVLQRARNRRA